jgi:hypothetical protein
MKEYDFPTGKWRLYSSDGLISRLQKLSSVKEVTGNIHLVESLTAVVTQNRSYGLRKYRGLTGATSTVRFFL